VKNIHKDCINLNHALAKFLAPRLTYMATFTSHPRDIDPDEWTGQLKTAGKALHDYALYDGFDEEVEKRADDAMLFVACYFHHLWD